MLYTLSSAETSLYLGKLEAAPKENKPPKHNKKYRNTLEDTKLTSLLLLSALQSQPAPPFCTCQIPPLEREKEKKKSESNNLFKIWAQNRTQKTEDFWLQSKCPLQVHATGKVDRLPSTFIFLGTEYHSLTGVIWHRSKEASKAEDTPEQLHYMTAFYFDNFQELNTGEECK